MALATPVNEEVVAQVRKREKEAAELRKKQEEETKKKQPDSIAKRRPGGSHKWLERGLLSRGEVTQADELELSGAKTKRRNRLIESVLRILA